MSFATQNFIRDAKDIPGPVQAIFYRVLSPAAIAAEKASIEATYYGVGYNYEQQHDASYKVTLTGPADKFKAAMNFLYPKNRPFDIIKVTTARGINIDDLTS